MKLRMFVLTLPNARHFKRCADCLRDVVHELTVHVTTDGLRAHACADGVVVEACFAAERAVDFEVLQECTFGLSTDTLAKLLRTASSEQRLRIAHQLPELWRIGLRIGKIHPHRIP